MNTIYGVGNIVKRQYHEHSGKFAVLLSASIAIALSFWVVVTVVPPCVPENLVAATEDNFEI